MKRFFIFAFISFALSGYSQNPLFTGYIDTDEIITKTTPTPDCEHNSAYWANYVNFIPTSQTPVYTVHLNFIIMQKSDGTGNYPNNQDTYDFFDDVVQDLNYHYANLVDIGLNNPQCFNSTLGESRYISSVKIQFDYDVHFFQSTSYWDFDNWYQCPYEGDYIYSFDQSFNIDPSNRRGINVYFPQSQTAYNAYIINDDDLNEYSTTSCSEPPDFYDMNETSRIYSPNSYTKYTFSMRHALDSFNTTAAVVRGWMIDGTAGMLKHELGHNFGINHSCPHYSLNGCIYSIMHQGFDVPGNWLPPSEIGKMHKNLHITNLKTFILPSAYFSSSPYSVNDHQVWDYNTRVYSDIVIENGGVLDIKCFLQMPELAKIIVKQGGVLNVDGGKITSYGNYLWRGIEVWGTSNQSQYEVGGVSYQGKVVLTNGATIENAYTGITNCNPAYQSTQAGGIILATETNFKNNRVAVDFVPYSNVLSGTVHFNLSYFVKCNFTRDNALANNTAFVSFADLKTVYGIKFYGCNFNDTYATSYSQQGTGIMSLDSYFQVIPYCNCSGNPCPTGCMEKGSFRNLAYGIRAQKANTNNYFVVDNTNFYHCNWCILNEGVSLVSITSSYFEFQPPLSGSTYETGIGIYAATNYTIEENQFTATGTSFTSTGVYFYNGGSENNYVYKNNFLNNSVGISTYGVCKSSNGSTGLQFQCNTFLNSTTYDINTRKAFIGGSAHGVRNLQGSSNSPEGNVFTSCTGSYKNFYNQATNTITYYYHGPGTLEDPLCNWPNYFTKNNTGTYTNSCTSHLGGGGGNGSNKSMESLEIQALEQDFITDKNAMLSFQDQFNQLLDGGNTNALGNEIDNSNVNNTWQLYNKLLNKSPYLTDRVLFKASNKSNVLPNVLLYNLLKQNPDALKSGYLMEHLAEKPLPLYGWMIDSLNVFRNQITARTRLEEKISYHAERKDQTGFKLIKDALMDTAATDHQRIQTWMTNMETFYSDIMAINDNMATLNYQTAESILYAMPSKYNLEDEYAIEYQWFVDLFGLFKQFHYSNKTIYELNSSELLQVKDIADNGLGCAKVYARNICRLYGFVYEPEFVVSDEAPAQNKSMIQNNPESQQSVNKEDNIECYPNPAKEWVIFKWETASSENSVIITIANSLSSIITTINTDGTIGEKILATNEWPIGIYYYKAEKNGQVVKSGKFVITR